MRPTLVPIPAQSALGIPPRSWWNLRMPRIPLFRFPILLLFLAMAGCASVPPPSVAGYHFGYRLRWFGSPLAKPVQIFDNGSDTYFELRPGSPSPVVFAIRGHTLAPVVARRHGLYLVAPGVAHWWRLVGPGGRGVAHQTGTRRSAPVAYLPIRAAVSAGDGAGSLPTTLNGSIGQLISRIQTLRAHIQAEQAHAAVHARPEPDVRRYAVSIPFPVGVYTIALRRKLQILRLARLLAHAFVVRIRANNTPGGTMGANRALAAARVKAVISLLHAADLPHRVFRIGRSGFRAAYPHVSVRFDLPVHTPR